MKSTVQVFSDTTCYWWRWGAVLLTCAVFVGLGHHLQGEAPAVTFYWLVLGIAAGGLTLALIHRPKNYCLETEGDELRILTVPHRRMVAQFPLKDLHYVSVRHTGHLFNLSVLRIVVRSHERGSLFFGPIYKNGVDAVETAAVARLLPRIARPIPASAKVTTAPQPSS